MNIDTPITQLTPPGRKKMTVEYPWPDVVIPPYKAGEYGRWKIAQTPVHVATAYWIPMERNPPGFALYEKKMGRWGSRPWMSFTAMERQSHMPHIAAAHGHVCVIGLGLGMAIFNMIKKPEVLTVSVLEKNKQVIKLFEEHSGYKDWDCADKIVSIHEGDALFQPKWEGEFDSLFVDMWFALGEAHALADVQTICQSIKAKSVGYWGQELDFVRWMTAEHRLPASLEPDILAEEYKQFAIASGLPLIGQGDPKYAVLAMCAQVFQAAHAIRLTAPAKSGELLKRGLTLIGVMK